ncbi:ion transporter [Ophiocordyceps camponoti-floridani]|uniref:Ion transporter n=1 Tax=Ophiocordyceps camponoti-floridani TaxID=2030778 RepID=A0A8H4QBL4_9HYPO|nr:ion transporter [Ophiocordyceps camponoti-floridani]
MPVRVKSKRPLPVREPSPVSTRDDIEMPEIDAKDSFRQVAAKLSAYFVDAIDMPSSFEQLRTTVAGNCLRDLVDHLHDHNLNLATVHALLALKWHYAAAHEHAGLNQARSYACEIVAWRFLTRLSEREVMDCCLYEIPDAVEDAPPQPDIEALETAPLLPQATFPFHAAVSSAKRMQLQGSLYRLAAQTDGDGEDNLDPTSAFMGLNALEIAAVADAKRFLSQSVVQKIVSGIWNGDIVFWDSLSVHATKKPRFYDPNTADPFSRLRVPKYLKSWEVLFFAVFLGLYYMVLVSRVESHITAAEAVLLIWIAAFAYDELSEWRDAGFIFYATDIWNLFDITMILIGTIFATLRVVGLLRDDDNLTSLAFDVLSLEALFMMPRICSILSLSPYWGTLVPCLKEMGRDFFKFMVLVFIVYLGFLTTFSLVGRDSFPFSKMTGILTSIFFGSSSVGLDIMSEIDPIFGPPLMLIFVTLTSILLMGSLTGMLSNSFSRVITHAKEEYLYVYSVYVLEASTSNRLTHFYPPFNLVALVVFRPFRIVCFATKHERFRAGRIWLLKMTHLPVVTAIQSYEFLQRKLSKKSTRPILKGPQSRERRPQRPRAMTPSNYSRPQTASRETRNEDARDGVESEAPTLVEAQVVELSEKIDRLLEMAQASRAGNG